MFNCCKRIVDFEMGGRLLTQPRKNCLTSSTIISDSGAQNCLFKSTSYEDNSTASNVSELQKEDEAVKVIKDQKIVIPVQQQHDLHVIAQSTISGNYTLITYNLTNYNRADFFHCHTQDLCPEHMIELSPCACKAFSFNGKISVLIGNHIKIGIWKTSLYYLDTESHLATWKSFSNFSPSFPELQLDFPNCFVVSHQHNEIIVVSIVNNRIIFHIISKSMGRTTRINRDITIAKLRIPIHTEKFIIQSCTVISNYIYCILLQQGVSAHICKFKFQKNTEKIQCVYIWHINDSTLQNCFVSVHNEKVMVICCKVADITILEIKCLQSNALSTESSFKFPHIVKIVTASIVPSLRSLAIVVTYQNNETNECYIKRIDMPPSHHIPMPSTAYSATYESPATKDHPSATKENLPAAKDSINMAMGSHVIPVSGPHQINCDGQSGGCFIWNECGLELNFPPKCSQQHIQVTTSSFLPIKNEVHPGMHIVSAVYQFNCNVKRFDKAFTLRLQHSIKLKSPEDCQKMRFVIQHDDGNDMKYGCFEAGQSYGTVKLNRFCHIFIIWIEEPWKNIHIIVLPLSGDEGNSSLFSIQQSSSASVEHSTSRTDQRGISQSADDRHSSVPPNANVDDLTTADSAPYGYEAMFCLPKDHCQLLDWKGAYSIYYNLGEWRDVRM